jgi:CHAD domain-containing protein
MANDDAKGDDSGDRREPRPAIAPDDPAAVAIRAALARGEGRLRGLGPEAGRGDPEGVHRLRTSSRRLRSELRTFRVLVDAHWARPLEDDLKWLAGLLGAVRDIDVLKERLRRSSGEALGDLGLLFLTLDERHAEASRALREALAGDRHRDLLRRLAEAAAAPVLQPEAAGPCRSALPPLVASAWKAVKKRGRALGPRDPDEDFHEVRKRAKRARHAAECVADALDPGPAEDARRFARLANEVQDVLGEHQDAIVAAREVRRIAGDHPADGVFNLACGRLLERQEHAARRSRDRFFVVWDRFDRKKHRRWLKP